MILLALTLIVIALYAAINSDIFSVLYWLFWMVPLVGVYRVVTRWKYSLPYPRSLIQNGRIVISRELDDGT